MPVDGEAVSRTMAEYQALRERHKEAGDEVTELVKELKEDGIRPSCP